MIQSLNCLKGILIFSVFFSFGKSYAQLGFCQGNSGDPIFLETFGTGLVDSPLPAGTTSYTYANGLPPDDGLYTVSSNTNYFDWFVVDDVTPNDTNGRMLIVNSDFSAGEFYRTTIAGLCENTSYEFSSWIINLAPAGGFCGSGVIPVNVRFEIWDNTDTNLLAIGDTGNIGSTSTPNWQQYALVFQTIPSQTSVILKMINNGVGGCGNDLAIDDITFKSCGDFISVTDSSNNDQIALCSNETPYATTLTATPDGSVFSSHFYQWQESVDGNVWIDIIGETNQSISISGVTSTTYYRAKVAEFASNLSNADCITYSNIFQLNITQLANPPILECWETATLNNSTCSWEITGTQPSPPTLQCWESASFNDTTCSWDVSGTQPEEPTGLLCWETASFNNTTCSWEVTGTQPDPPTLECWETATFDTTSCSWDVAGMQPEEPTGLACWETATFNNTTCSWEITGTQPEEPTGLQCWESATFSNTNCSWEVTGSQPTEPDIACWETAVFNDVSCSWEVSGTQPEEPTDLACWEIATFEISSCSWEISGEQSIEFIEEFVSFCEGETTTIQANTEIINATYQWNTGETSEFIDVDTSGTYTVISSDGCSTIEKTIYVEQLDAPIIETVLSDGNDIVVLTSNSGVFLYSLDGVNFQTSNIFFDIDGGQYTIFVKAIDCEQTVTVEHLHFYIPKFFTPNGDTDNEVFDLKGIEYFESSQVLIFDRYGKLLVSSKNRPFFWDGTFKNQPLPTSDYWYIITINGQEFKGHFTLKR